MRQCAPKDKANFNVFQSTHSIRSATPASRRHSGSLQNFNPRTPYGVRLQCRQERVHRCLISIHALHTECDIFKFFKRHTFINFNPRTPYGVRPSNWNETALRVTISIHALHTECDEVTDSFEYLAGISIHALHTECDCLDDKHAFNLADFNPRTPYGVRPVSLAALL